jgi:cytoskeleton-associated protein 5
VCVFHLGFVLKRMSQLLDKVKAPLAHQYYLEWLKRVVGDFGPAIFPVQSTAAFCHLEMENRSAPVRTGAVEVLGTFYHHLGPRFMSVAFTDDMKPASKSLLEAEFEKVGFDPAAAGKVSRAPKGQAVAAAGGSIPRVDLAKALDGSVVADLSSTNGKNSWEARKAAMEAIVQACERSGHFVEGNPFAKGLLKSLKERLNDTQANLKPLAATTMGHVIRAMDLESSVRAFRVLSGPLLAGVADNKKSMRDATLAALTMVVTQGIVENATRPDANLVGALVPALAEAAQNPVGRTELLSFFVTQVDSDAVLKCDWTEVLTSLVSSLQDKTPTCRAAAEQLFCSLITKGYVSRPDAAKSFRDLSPAAMRSLQAVMDRIVSTTMEGAALAATLPSAPPPAAAVEAPAKVARETVRPAKTERVKASKDPSSDDAPSAPAVQEVPDAPTSATFPLKKTSKAKRLDDFYKQNWPQPPEDPGATEMHALKSVWEPLIAPELYQIVFEDNKSGLANQDSVMGAMSELMSLLSGDDVGATSGLQYGSAVNDMVVQHTDLILRWAALALCLRESTSGLMHVLLLISKVIDKIHHINGQLHEGEISVILPALIERSGHKSERHKAAFKSVISAARRVVPSSRLCQLLVQV